MDLDRDSLELMLNLLDTDSRIKDALDSSGMNKRELEKNKQKVNSYEDIKMFEKINLMTKEGLVCRRLTLIMQKKFQKI